MTVQIKESDFTQLYKNMKKLDKNLTRKLARNLRKPAKKVIPEIQRAVMQVPSTKKSDIKSPEPIGLGLRASIAASIKVGIKATKSEGGVFVRVDRKQFVALSGGRNEKLPKLLDGTYKRWKHPVFGRNMDKPETWPIQPYHRYFGVTLIKHKDEFFKEVIKSIEQFFEDLSKK